MAENNTIPVSGDNTVPYPNDTRDEQTTISEYNISISTSAAAAPIVEELAYVSYIIVPTICVIGLFGNIFNIVIMRTKYFRASSFSIFLTALAMSDSMYLLTAPFTWTFMKEVFNKDVRAITDDGCKAFFCFFRTAKIGSSWMVVVICIERFIAVWFPLKAKIISNKTTACITSLIVFIVVFAIDGAWTLTSGVVDGVCHPNLLKPGLEGVAIGFVIFGTAIFNIIPTVLLLIFTPLIILKLFRQREFRRQIAYNTSNDETYRITSMLLWITVAYIVLVTPISTAHSLAFFQGMSIFESAEPNFVAFREVAQVMEQMNYSVNFFLYFSTNRTFRNKVFVCLGCRKIAGGHTRQDFRSPVQQLPNNAASISGNGSMSSSTSLTS